MSFATYKAANKLFGVDSLEQADIEIYERLYRTILAEAPANIEDTPIEAQHMIKRLEKFEQETLLSMYDLSVPIT